MKTCILIDVLYFQFLYTLLIGIYVLQSNNDNNNNNNNNFIHPIYLLTCR